LEVENETIKFFISCVLVKGLALVYIMIINTVAMLCYATIARATIYIILYWYHTTYVIGRFEDGPKSKSHVEVKVPSSHSKPLNFIGDTESEFNAVLLPPALFF